MLISPLREDLCLDFANTLSWRGSEPTAEALQDLACLLGWLETSASVGAGALREVAGWSHAQPVEAAKVLAEAVAVREAIHGAFTALASGGAVADQDFATLRGALAAAPARTHLARREGGYAWQVEPPWIEPAGPSAAALLAPVLWSAADLMIKGASRSVRQCANGKCLWLFLDASKNGTRRWCDMASCGNRAKARRHYLKTKLG